MKQPFFFQASFKLILSFLIIISTTIMPNGFWIGFLILGYLLFVAFIISDIPVKTIAKRLLVILPFILSFSILTLFKQDGFEFFLYLIIKSTLCIITILLLTSTTSFSDLLNVLKKTPIPKLFITIMMLTYRYLYVLIDERERLKRAKQSRTFNHKQKHIWKNLATIIALLFIRASERADRVYHAMCARGWET
ncbi:MAG: cobalt ECF transporter T component CbiQ [bacterium]|nr:cobalt ECF transporter T component CbiQ [bacterium]MBU1918696.1 cobalt ECF transporter T component CbiQ [bacterium]